ncbi:MAG TPA: aromatic amino acid lyase [Solirubrobacteraceae bacterium]|nr:aromatic amino acid lyase [Solirubrobacteraceae bacterium]
MSTAATVLLERPDQLDLPTYRRIVFERAPVVLADALLGTVQQTRDALLAHLAGGASAYGVTTGLGFLAGHAVAVDDHAAFQRSILAGRSAGTGPPLSEAVVRGAMLLRLTGFLSGHAGVSAELCRFIAARLNDGWYPVVPGGVSGAAGEIVPLSHLFGTLVGDGFVHLDGRIVPAADALATAQAPPAAHADEAPPSVGVAPYELGAKEGIALINGAPLAPALAVPLLLRAEALLDHATLGGALTIALTGASLRPYTPRIGALKGDPGQLAIHRRLWSLLEPTPDRLLDTRQAPISLRVIPQVHGAAAEFLGHLRAQVERELRAVTDSPAYLPAADPDPDRGPDPADTDRDTDPGAHAHAPSGTEPEGLYSTGNFHAQYLVLLFAAATTAFAQVVNLLEKRLHRLLDARFSKLPDQLTPDPGRRSGVVVLHKQVLGITAQARMLAAPAGVHVLDGSTGQEDFQAHTQLAATQLDGVLSALELALAHELVALRQASFLAGAELPAPLQDAVSLLAEVAAPVTEDRALAADVERVRDLVASGRLVGGVRCPGIWS